MPPVPPSHSGCRRARAGSVPVSVCCRTRLRLPQPGPGRRGRRGPGGPRRYASSSWASRLPGAGPGRSRCRRATLPARVGLTTTLNRLLVIRVAAGDRLGLSLGSSSLVLLGRVGSESEGRMRRVGSGPSRVGSESEGRGWHRGNDM